MPTFNHESNIEDTLGAAAAAALHPFDCIIVDDASEDGTVERATAFFESRRPTCVARATIIRNPVPVYETACDNLGFTLADTEVVIEVQADIQIREPAFDAVARTGMLDVASRRPLSRVGAATPSRCSLAQAACARCSAGGRTRRSDCAATPSRRPTIIDRIKGQLYRCETVNRGPWLVFKTDLERHGYLDERHFFLGNDDHDYHRRLFDAEQRRPIYVPLSLHAPLALGAHRRKRTGVNREVFMALHAEKRGSPAFHRFLNALGPTFGPVAIT